ncbi:MAG: hypothetical protein K5906_01355 [Bacilli bacterium]|nr:hypothetical protein [Bacilli bacterium]
MRISLTKEEESKVIKLLETKEENIAIASMLNELCFSLEAFPELKNYISKSDKEVSEYFIEMIYQLFELDPSNNDNKRIIDQYLSSAFSYKDVKEYNANPFKNNVNIKEKAVNHYNLHYLTYPKYSFFPLDDIKVDDKDYYKEYTKLSFFNEDYEYLTLSKNNNIWMCITPNEINTMKPHIDHAHGHVIAFGLGLGYFAYMVANKKEVQKVTIIERDEEIINLFKDNLLPLFKNRDKIEIISSDAFEYIKKDGLIHYDYAFFDLWHNAEDGLPMYLKIKEMKIYPETHFWIEESLIAMYRRCLLTVIEESLNHYSDDDYRKSKNAIDKVINTIYFKTKNLKLNSYKEIYNLLSKESILKLISK